MGFEIVSESGRSNPRAFCDHCKQLIVGSGNVERERGESSRHSFLTLHKPCSRQMDVERRAKGLPRTVWMPLDHFVIYLGNSLEMDWEESTRHAEQLASI
jgi:hypothetical protein